MYIVEAFAGQHKFPELRPWRETVGFMERRDRVSHGFSAEQLN